MVQKVKLVERTSQRRRKVSASSNESSTSEQTTSSDEQTTNTNSTTDVDSIQSPPVPLLRGSSGTGKKVSIQEHSKVDVGGRRNLTTGVPIIRPAWSGQYRSQNNQNKLNDNSNAEGDDNEEGMNELKLSPFYEGYDVRDHLDKWRLSLPIRITISDWAYHIKTSRRKKDRTQVDKLVGEVCSGVLSMRELPHFSQDSGSNCFLWVNASLSRKFLRNLKIGNQMIGRVHGEALFKDKQCLANILDEYKFKEWIAFAPHICLDENKDLIRRNAQRICKHQYIGHYFSKCMDATDTLCPNREYKFCECFRKVYFMPEFVMFPHYYIMEKFLKRYETDVDFQKTTWLAKPAYLTAGKGFFLIRSPQEFRYFYQVRNESCVRREGFVLQRYLNRPCHIAGNKVDVRMYLMLSVLNGRRVCGFFHPGYVRQAAQLWGTKAGPGGLPSGDIFEHLTSRELFKLKNVKLPKKPGLDEEDDDDEEDEEGAIQCIEYNTAVERITAGGKDQGKNKKSEKENLHAFAGDDDEQEGGFTEAQFDKYHFRFKYMIEVLCQKLDPIVRHKPGSFQIFGLDIFIDADTKPWLLEINSHVATEQIFDVDQVRVISNVVTEGICIHSELFQKSMQEELIFIEIQQRDQKLSKLTRAQRMLTAKSQQEEIDALTIMLEKTEISVKKPPIFLQNFFWWYDTPPNKWHKPWINKKKVQKTEMAWYSRMFHDLIIKDEMTNKKNFKADGQTRMHDNMDYFKHMYWREQLEKDMKKFETEKIAKREEMISNIKKLESEKYDFGNNNVSMNNALKSTVTSSYQTVSQSPQSSSEIINNQNCLKNMRHLEEARLNAEREMMSMNNRDLIDLVRTPVSPINLPPKVPRTVKKESTKSKSKFSTAGKSKISKNQ